MTQILGRLLAFTLCVAGLPVHLVICLAIVLLGRGPAIYRSKRIGRHGRIYTMFKYRSMKAGCPAVINEELKLVVDKSDPRVTLPGRLLRCGLDELPQLWNVVRGEMRWIGPRPDESWMLPRHGPVGITRLDMTPGITGLAQVLDSRNCPTGMGYAIDIWYRRTRNWLTDLWVIGATPLFVLGWRSIGWRRLHKLLKNPEFLDLRERCCEEIDKAQRNMPPEGIGGTQRPVVYLFTNHTFGWQFTKRLMRHARRGEIDLTLVYRRMRIGHKWNAPLLRRIVCSLRRALLSAASFTRQVRIVECDDVNGGSFLDKVPAGVHGVVAGFDGIFTSHTIQRFETLVNFHASILPYYRGPVPSYWVIRNGESRSGYTLHAIVEKIDAGPILYQGVVSCAGARRADQLNRRIADSALSTLDRYLAHLSTGFPWKVTAVDADSVYRVPVNYGRRPDSVSPILRPAHGEA